ncbi:MAG: 1-acylglycerol-3-phosphate O-acyltransferase [Gammaproteobacteria bacterium]|nr:1-acylglycerol-3-phosphate O-acyltransferase [Gammaproteobacteria bacterium]
MRLIMGLKYICRDSEHLDSHRPCVFVSNHQDNVDLIAGSLTIPRKTVSLGKDAIMFIPIFGLFYWLSGNIFINRTNSKKAKKSMTKVTNAINNNGTSVWIMPEGTRKKEIGLLPFKTGAFRTAIDAGVPIVPICFNSYGGTANYNKLNAGTIACQVLEPIQTTGLHKIDATKLAKDCFDLMSATIEQLDQEFPSSN